VYIPLGGNRGSGVRTYFNLALVFVLCGLWHGAAWTFILWGLWHGTLLVIERLGLGELLTRLPRLVAHLYTLLAVILGWVLFRADSVAHAWNYWGAMFGLAQLDGAVHPWQRYAGPSALTALALGLTLAVVPALMAKPLSGAAKSTSGVRVFGTSAALAAGFALCVLSLASNTYNPFIYFRF
jgi:alginate O-acetyltransferase complex protein AlgI